MNTLTDTEKRAVAFGLQFALELVHAGEITSPHGTFGIDVTDTQHAFAECLKRVEHMPEDMARKRVQGLIDLGGPALVEAWGRPRQEHLRHQEDRP